jgi:hypothetical protein
MVGLCTVAHPHYSVFHNIRQFPFPRCFAALRSVGRPRLYMTPRGLAAEPGQPAPRLKLAKMPLIYILSSRTGNVSSNSGRKNLELPDLEIFAFIASVFLSLKSWLTWYSDIASVNCLRIPVSKRLVLLTAPLVCLAVTLIALTKLAATTVRNDALYISFYLLVGAGWLGGMTLIRF